MLWTCHKERPGVCRKKGDGMELPGKKKRGRPKRRFLDVVKEDIREVGAREKNTETGRFGETLYAVATPD